MSTEASKMEAYLDGLAVWHVKLEWDQQKMQEDDSQMMEFPERVDCWAEESFCFLWFFEDETVSKGANSTKNVVNLLPFYG